MKKKILNIEGMTCSACSNGLEKYLNKQKGIQSASVNLVMAQAEVVYNENLINTSDLNRFVKEAGFKSLGEQKIEKNNKLSLVLIITFAVIAIFLMYISMGEMIGLKVCDVFNKNINPKTYASIQIIFTTLFLIWAVDILKNGIKNLIHLMPNMDSLVGIGVIVNFVYSLVNSIFIYKGDYSYAHNLYFESSCMIILFIKIGRYIDKKNKAKAVDAIKNLVTITPKNAIILKDEREHEVTINEIEKGDIVVSKPGEKIAVDGVIIKGKTHTDESFITGESTPVRKIVGMNVLAGSINYDGYIEYKAEKIGKDSSISHIVDMVVEATNTKAPIARLADKISGYFVPFIFLVAMLSFCLNFLITKNISNSINALVSVLVVACPCSLGLATPLAMVVSIGKASKKGILIKSSECIEISNKIDTVAFDKTGTLTKGKLEIADLKYDENFSKEEILKLIQSIEQKSNHPLAKSICKNAKELYDVINFEEIAGFGVRAEINKKGYYAGNKKFVDSKKIQNRYEQEEKIFASKAESIVYFFDDEKVLAIIGLRDEVKNDAKSLIKQLKSMKKAIIMLSGDNEITANAIAKELEIDKVYSNVSPDEKLNKVKELSKNKNVLMVGDGINDSPALKSAAIGLSVSNGTDISSDSSDIVLLNENMKNISEVLKIGNKTIKIIKQNLFWALFYNVCMIPIATGLLPIKLNPMIASFAMTISSLTVVMNSLRLKK